MLLLSAAGGGLALLAAAGPQDTPPTLVPAAAAASAGAVVAPAPLDPSRDDRSERASRSRRAAAQDPESVPEVGAEPVPVTVPVPEAAERPAAPATRAVTCRVHRCRSLSSESVDDTVMVSPSAKTCTTRGPSRVIGDSR